LLAEWLACRSYMLRVTDLYDLSQEMRKSWVRHPPGEGFFFLLLGHLYGEGMKAVTDNIFFGLV
jgi:hypothetical protein